MWWSATAEQMGGFAMMRDHAARLVQHCLRLAHASPLEASSRFPVFGRPADPAARQRHRIGNTEFQTGDPTTWNSIVISVITPIGHQSCSQDTAKLLAPSNMRANGSSARSYLSLVRSNQSIKANLCSV